ncbi:hypothetical protein [Neorhizobium galegae]|uniref:hypothetical protein n=1 Tax=Neorhizobium galegae TaxID=399 RepID=UPI00062176D0|nr:hypothetical protein [Neorhizobium galegae]KAB1126307.1 hypothetical protein F4V90_04110 [Neorhizobium galegae]MCQ1805279.1 hypothetical protein [Neorhizobium galegae]CDZ56040.1 Hypothetical protein NGAL_HAMBI2566_05900 [Neorhizobium galegae bv. orientalis]
MAKLLLAYAYTTTVTKDGTALNRPDAFTLDQNTPILLDHPDMTNSPRVNKGVILSSAYDEIGCKVAVVVFDDDLGVACKGLSITAPLKAYASNKSGMTPLEVSLCKEISPNNPDCKILSCRDATPIELSLAELGDNVRKMSALASIMEEMKSVVAR